jgi:hypothetical protein
LRSAAPVGQIVSSARGIFHDLARDVPVKFSTSICPRFYTLRLSIPSQMRSEPLI